MSLRRIFSATGALLFCTFAAAAQMSVETILPETEVDAEGDLSVFATPFDYHRGQAFTVHVEPADGSGADGVNLRTVVRHGKRRTDGSWEWSSKVIENRTIRDPWHTQASIALDKLGYVHVAYNMHNMPWQYMVSDKPLDISGFTFRGDAVSINGIKAVKFENRTPFPRLGTAAISGTQVTYPMFFKDPAGELYVTYRYALRPARSWEQRAFAGGVAKYDSAADLWVSLGGQFQISRGDAVSPYRRRSALQSPFAYEEGYSVYLITLAFDDKGGLHAFWNWRPGGAGTETMNPSYAFSPDGKSFLRSDGTIYSMPIAFKVSDVIAPVPERASYYAPKSAAVFPDREPAVVIHDVKGGRQLIRLDSVAKRWRSPEPMPSGASEIIVDKQGSLWAFASGIKVFVRTTTDAPWEEVGQVGRDLCSPKSKYFPEEDRFIVHAKSCDGRLATIFSFRR